MTRINSVITALLFLLLAVTTAGCSQKNDSQPAAATADKKPAPMAQHEQQSGTDAASELAGTSWQLVKIMEMDDSVDEPDDRSLYTLQFGEDGRAFMRADCNRGNGTWSSEAPGQLQFGPIASTRAMCPPESLSDKYLAQFGWVRSYVMENGHIFLATMADGAIIEFEPAPASE
jgi:heat shock protein HslJ